MSYQNDELPSIFKKIAPGDITEPFDFQDPLVALKGVPSEVKNKVAKKDVRLMIEKLERHPAFFSRTQLYVQGVPFVLAPKQEELWNSFHDNQFTVGTFNRQGGKSTTVAGYDTQELAFATDEDITILYAPIKNQANIIYKAVSKNIRRNPLLTSFMDTTSKEELIARNGNTLISLSASENSHVRGMSPNKIQLDETQGISNRVYYEDILPSGTSTDAKVQEIGTPKGRNHFYDTVMNNPSYKRIIQRWQDCPFVSKVYIDTFRRQMTKEQFSQEFECEWNINEGAVWAYSLIKEIMAGEYVPKQPIDVGTCYAGMDVGQSPAETVVSIFEYVPNFGFVQVYLNRLAIIGYEQIINEASADLDAYRPEFTVIDQTGVGKPVLDIIEDRLGGRNSIMGLQYDQAIKQEMVDNFTLLCEAGLIHLIEDDEQRRQMMGWQRKATANGKYKYKSESGIHDDIVNANILAIHAAKLMDAGSEGGVRFAVGAKMNVTGSSVNLNRELGFDLKAPRPTW